MPRGDSPARLERVAGGRVEKPKKKPKIFGHTATRFEVGPEKSSFMLHEDLLCSNSSYFKSKLQSNRKPIDEETLCAICLEFLNSKRDEVLFCKQCGQNIHKKCMQEWLERDRSCPSCRSLFFIHWKPQTLSFQELDADSFEVYIQWLYTDTLILVPDYDDEYDNVKKLAELHVFGELVQDARFSQAVACKIIGTCTNAGTLDYIRVNVHGIYANTEENSAIRRLIVDLVYVAGNAESLDDDLPFDFLFDFAKNYFEERPKTMDELCAKYCGEFKLGDMD